MYLTQNKADNTHTHITSDTQIFSWWSQKNGSIIDINWDIICNLMINLSNYKPIKHIQINNKQIKAIKINKN